MNTTSDNSFTVEVNGTTYRPWKSSSEVPFGALTRRRGGDGVSVTIIVGTTNTLSILTGQSGSHSAKFYLEYGEYSIDQGKTWQPCGVPVNTQ